MAQPGMDDMYAVDGQRHAWAGHSCGAVQDKALKFFPYASPSGKAEGSADYQEKTKQPCVCDICGSDLSCKSNLAKHKKTKKCQRFLV